MFSTFELQHEGDVVVVTAEKLPQIESIIVKIKLLSVSVITQFQVIACSAARS